MLYGRLEYNITWPIVTGLIKTKKQIQHASTPDTWYAIANSQSKYSWDADTYGTPEDPNVYWSGIKYNVLRRVIHERTISDGDFVECLCKTGNTSLYFQHADPLLTDPVIGWGRLLEEMRQRLQHTEVSNLAKWMLPNWLKYPEIPRGSIGCRMGYGESYRYTWQAWFTPLPDNQKQQYKNIYPDWPSD